MTRAHVRALPRALSLALAATVLFVGCAPEKEVSKPSGPVSEEEARLALESIGYLGGARSARPSEIADSSRAAGGLTLYESRKERLGVLINEEGEVVHRWRVPTQLMAGHVKLAPNGDLLVILYEGDTLGDVGILRLDWEGNELWRRLGRYHHDVHALEDGSLYTIEQVPIWVEHEGQRLPLLDDQIVLFDPEGEVVGRWSIYEMVGKHVSDARWEAIARAFAADPRPWPETFDPMDTKLWPRINTNSPYDAFHTNSIDVLARDRGELLFEGDLLTSVRNLDLIVVFDPETGALRWEWGRGELDHQHHPTQLANGNILVFDNGSQRGYSRVLEIDPLQERIVWSYPGEPTPEFFSRWQGASQELDEGNVMIVESGKGRIFEITREGEVVWEYLVPPVEGERDIVYRAYRVEGELDDLLRERLDGAE